MTMAENFRELGYAQPRYNRTLEIPELRFPHASRVYSEMIRDDAQVAAIYKAVTLPIRRSGWWIDDNGADEEIVNHISQDLRLPVKGQKYVTSTSTFKSVSWDKHLEQVLTALLFGHAYFEQVYEVRDDGKEHLRKLAIRPSVTITNINVAKDGGLDSIIQGPYEGGKEVKIPVDRLVAYVHDPKDNSWQGTSLFRAAYDHYYLKELLQRLEFTALERNSLGVPVYTGSELTKPESTADELQNGQDLVEGFRSGEYAGVSIPPGAKLELLGLSGQILSPREAIDYHNEMIAKTALAHFLNLSDGGGSYALASTQQDLFIQHLQTIAEWIADVATQHIVEDLVKIAYPEYEGALPRIAFDSIGSKTEYTPSDLAMLLQNKVILPDETLEEYVRRRGNLPPKQDYVQAMKDKAERLEQVKKIESEKDITLNNDDNSGDSQ